MAMSGTDVILLVNTGTPSVPAYTAAGSQRDVSFDKSRGEIDVSSKDSSNYRTIPGGKKKETLQLNSLFVPNDAAYLALESAWNSDELILVAKQVAEVTVATASALITNMSERHPDGGESTISISLTVDGSFVSEES